MLNSKKIKIYFSEFRENRKQIFIVIILTAVLGFLLILYFRSSNSALDDNLSDNPREYIFYDIQDSLESSSIDELNFSENFKKSTDYNNEKIITVNPEENLSEIIFAAELGQIIELEQGTYNINLEIDKNIMLVGQGENTIFQAKNQEKAVIKINNSDFTLNNLVLRNSRIGVEAYNANLSVLNVKFVSHSATACYAKDSKLDFIDSYIYDSNSALKLYNSEGKITDSIIKNNKKSGIHLLGSDFIIKRNIIMDNESYGIFLDQNSEADIKNNCIADNDGYNVRIEKNMEIYR